MPNREQEGFTEEEWFRMLDEMERDPDKPPPDKFLDLLDEVVNDSPVLQQRLQDARERMHRYELERDKKLREAQ